MGGGIQVSVAVGVAVAPVVGRVLDRRGERGDGLGSLLLLSRPAAAVRVISVLLSSTDVVLPVSADSEIDSFSSWRAKWPSLICLVPMVRVPVRRRRGRKLPGLWQRTQDCQVSGWNLVVAVVSSARLQDCGGLVSIGYGGGFVWWCDVDVPVGSSKHSRDVSAVMMVMMVVVVRGVGWMKEKKAVGGGRDFYKYLVKTKSRK